MFHNIIASILDRLKTFSEIIVLSKCGPLARIERAGCDIKTGPAEKFLKNKRNTPVSSPQSKINN